MVIKTYPNIKHLISLLRKGQILMINVFLDDKRPNPSGFILVRTADQAIDLLKKERIKILSLDYNLGTKPFTGHDVVRYMVKHNVYPQKIIIHSANPFGRKRMLDLLKKYKPKSVSLTVYPLPYKL